MALVPGLALWAGLSPLPPLILVASPTYRESAFIAGNEEFLFDQYFDFVSTNLADLPTGNLGEFGLQKPNGTMKYDWRKPCCTSEDEKSQHQNVKFLYLRQPTKSKIAYVKLKL